MNNGFNNLIERWRNAWNVFLDRSPSEETKPRLGAVRSAAPHIRRLQYGNEKSIVGSIYNRIAVDVSTSKIRHIRVDGDDMYVETIESGLNSCLSVESNIDQTHRDFLRDVVISLCDEGVVALVPVDTSISLTKNNTFDILSIRTGRIVQWYPRDVRVRLYNDNSGEYEEITISKTKVAIIENPFYSIMNEKNSIVQRLIAKLNLLDVIDNQSGSGKLDLIIQLPYVIKSALRKQQAEERRKSIEDQLKNSQYGVAYTDGTERVIQLNRPVENNLMAQIEYLTRMVYAQLGISESILNGTADEKELLSYYNRIVEPMVSAITTEVTRKFLSRTARTQGQRVAHFRDLFSIVTPERLADLADKLTRNEIASPNDLRAVVGWKPSKDKSANELRNRNINQPEPDSEDKSMDVTDEFKSVSNKAKENKSK